MQETESDERWLLWQAEVGEREGGEREREGEREIWGVRGRKREMGRERERE